MNVAWTTIAVILFLLPGIGFFVGYWSQERYSREIVSSTAVGEVGMALFVALGIHFAVFAILRAATGFSLFAYILPLIDFDSEPRSVLVDQIQSRISPIIVYILVTCVLSFIVGLIIARIAMFGFLRQYFAAHGWAYDLISEKKRSNGIVTTHVLTNLSDNTRTIMYLGHLEDFYLDASGSFSYIVLKNCSRFYMVFDPNAPTTTARVPLFRVPDHADRRWEHLVIQGSTIANVLFDPLGETIIQTDATQRALEEALAALLREQAHAIRSSSTES
jgi:NADH:ubiquinone oxidoreductase subunit 5 (subunit L)/multisubunit Na+/H+ antiporter MnhA subunit